VTDVSSPPAPLGDAVRERLLAAAAEVFAERGYERAGVAEIARRAGLTTGAIYSRYAGKAELLLDAIDARTHDEIRRLLGGDRPPERGTAVLAALGTHLVEPVADSGHALVFEAFVAARRDPKVAEILRRRIEDQDAPTAPSTRRCRPTPWCFSATRWASGSCSMASSIANCRHGATGRK
jgi:AcrR family transcriptional regulator